jgi:predicted membrane protein
MKRAIGILLFLLVLLTFYTNAFATSKDEIISEQLLTLDEIIILLIVLLGLTLIVIIILLFNIKNKCKKIDALNSTINENKDLHEKAMKELENSYSESLSVVSADFEKLQENFHVINAKYEKTRELYPDLDKQISEMLKKESNSKNKKTVEHKN